MVPASASIWVYPRVCGGTRAEPVRRWSRQGLSPRVRGNRLPPVNLSMMYGSIPACAGEPIAAGELVHDVRVYPRVCGGTSGAVRLSLPCQGLSPRVRGNRSAYRFAAFRFGSIPACAGGTGPFKRNGQVNQGLSPRVRGNRLFGDGTYDQKGSIPACAGEPAATPAPLFSRRVYPRRVRGNRDQAHAD